MGKVCPIILVASKKPRVMFFGYQLAPKNLITNARILCPLFDVHKSKLVVVK
jgi:hypothetical protein